MIIIVIKDEQDVPRLKGIPYLAYIIQQILLMGCQVQDPVECPRLGQGGGLPRNQIPRQEEGLSTGKGSMLTRRGG